jgi:hypothetical protein
MQCARAILSSVACPTLQHFSTLFHKLHDFRKKSYWTQNVCFDFHYKFAWNIFQSQKKWARYDSRSNAPVIVVRFSRNVNFLNSFSKNTEISNFMNIHSVIPSGRTNRRSEDMTKLIGAFRNMYYVYRILTILTLRRFSYFSLCFKFFVVVCNSL